MLAAGAGKIRPRAGGEVASPRVVSVPAAKLVYSAQSEADKDKTAASAAAAALEEATKNAGDPSKAADYVRTPCVSLCPCKASPDTQPLSQKPHNTYASCRPPPAPFRGIIPHALVGGR